MPWTIILELLGSGLTKFVKPYWKQLLIALIIGIALLYGKHLYTENKALTAQNKTLVADNIQFHKNELQYLKTISDQNGSISKLKSISDQQAQQLTDATQQEQKNADGYAKAIAKLRAQVYPKSCQGVMDLMLQKAVEKKHE